MSKAKDLLSFYESEDQWKTVVDDYAKGKVQLSVGQKIDKRTITDVGTHTIQFDDEDGYSGSTQIPFVDDQGHMTDAGRKAKTEIGESVRDDLCSIAAQILHAANQVPDDDYSPTREELISELCQISAVNTTGDKDGADV
jgi:hypothetical protein